MGRHTILFLITTLTITAQDRITLQDHVELAQTYCNQGDLDAATIHLRHALLNGIPPSTQLAFTISNLMLTVGNIGETIRILEHLQAALPDNITIMHNRALVYKIMGNYDQAVTLLHKILTIKPDHEESHFALGHTLLAMGNFEQGWAQHDRFLSRTNRYTPQLKEWIRNGQLKGKHILLIQEGGLGDTIQWIRCAQPLKEAGATITACVPQAIIKLLAQCPYIDHFLLPNAPYPQNMHIDAKATIMSLPAMLNLQESTMAGNIPYIFPDKQLVQYWQEKLHQDKNFKIAMSWQADINNDKQRLPFARRSIPVEKFIPLASLPHTSFYSLQVNFDTKEIETIANKLKLTVFDNEFDKTHGAFMDSAAIIEHMDLIITIDSAIAHLAGALGKPAWLLLPYQTDWRWIANRTDSPWYPSMHIFKQPKPFDWEAVIEKVYDELRQKISIEHPLIE
jgi:ADP-heptose:LPS heptosyltransferase